MNEKSYTTTEILRELDVPFWRLEHLVRGGRVTPLNRGRGRERRFSVEEFEKARLFLTDVAGNEATYDPA